MAGIDPDFNRQLMATLRRCDAFASNADLRAVFVDGRLSPWAYNVPEGESTAGRVQATIAYLHDKANAQGQNALVLLLYVLQDRYDPNDAYYGELGALIVRLSSAPSSLPPTIQPSMGSRIDYEVGLRLLLSRLGIGHPRYGEALVYQQRLTENLITAGIQGTTETQRAERAEIIARLNALSLSTLGVSFNELSGMSAPTAPQSVSSQPFSRTETPAASAPAISSNTPDLYDQNYKTKLFGLLTRHFDLGELQVLCFTMGLKDEDIGLRADSLSRKVTALLQYCERHTCMADLVRAGRTLRPELDWS